MHTDQTAVAFKNKKSQGFLGAALAALAALCTVLALGSTLAAPPAQARSIRFQLDIPEQSLEAALQQVALASQHKLLYRTELVEGKNSPGIKGEFTTEEAVQKLLAGTDLTYDITASEVVLIRAGTAPPVGPSKDKQVPATTSTDFSKDGLSVGGDQKKSFWNRFRVAEADQGQTAVDTSAKVSEVPPQSNEGVRLEEIVVTAQKKQERLQEVPVPVTAISSGELVNRGQFRFEDYYTRFPAVSLTLIGDGGTPSPTIRGVTTGGGTNPTVGFVVDDVAFGMSTITGLGLLAPDFDPSELSSIEVLRGPQGTLYGANSLGGLVKYMTIDPSTERFSGRIQAGVTGIKNGDGAGYSVRGAVNVPVSDTFAVRLSGSGRRDPGYIDDPSLGIDGVNRVDSSSGRLAALWRPTDAFSLKLSALLQDTKRDGDSYVFRLPGLGDLEHTALRNTGEYELKLQAYSATATADLGRASLVSLTGYSTNEISTGIDAALSASLVTATQTQFNGISGVTNPQRRPTKKFSQEVRISVPIGETVEWLLGGFYTREKYVQNSDILALDPSNGAVAGTWLNARRPSEFNERAAFTNLTFDVTDRFDIQVGGRASKIEFATGAGETLGPWNTVILRLPSQHVVTPEFVSKDNAFTYLVTPRFRFSSDLMVYARLASGYRPGGPNPSSSVIVLGLPKEYGADTTQNYEIGVKGSAWGGAFSFDASVYSIDWKDIQIELRAPPPTFLPYTTNAGQARSKGVELSMETRPSSGLTIAGWIAYNDAELTEIPATSVLSAHQGDRLPYSSRYSGNLSIDQEFPVAGHTGFVGASFSYVDDRIGSFQRAVPPPQIPIPRATFPSYTQVDLRAGAHLDSWTINAFVNNVTDKRGVLRSGADALFGLPYIFNYTQPRTIGLSVEREF